MFRPPQQPERAQAGIGTLIIFIAMILVAAIAAGVFFDITGSLRGSASETSQQSADQVTTRLEVINVVGTDVTDTVDTVEITVRSASGSGIIDIGSTTIQWLGPSGSVDLRLGATADATQFAMDTARDEDSSIADSDTLNGPKDRATLRFDAAAIGGQGLGAGSTVTLSMTTGTGGTTTVYISVPEPLSPGSSVSL